MKRTIRIGKDGCEASQFVWTNNHSGNVGAKWPIRVVVNPIRTALAVFATETGNILRRSRVSGRRLTQDLGILQFLAVAQLADVPVRQTHLVNKDEAHPALVDGWHVLETAFGGLGPSKQSTISRGLKRLHEAEWVEVGEGKYLTLGRGLESQFRTFKARAARSEFVGPLLPRLLAKDSLTEGDLQELRHSKDGGDPNPSALAFLADVSDKELLSGIRQLQDSLTGGFVFLGVNSDYTSQGEYIRENRVEEVRRLLPEGARITKIPMLNQSRDRFVLCVKVPRDPGVEAARQGLLRTPALSEFAGQDLLRFTTFETDQAAPRHVFVRLDGGQSPDDATTWGRISKDLTDPKKPYSCIVIPRSRFERHLPGVQERFRDPLRTLRGLLEVKMQSRFGKTTAEKDVALDWEGDRVANGRLRGGRLVTVYTYGEVPAIQVGVAQIGPREMKVVIFDDLPGVPNLPPRSERIEGKILRTLCRSTFGFGVVMTDYADELAQTLHAICRGSKHQVVRSCRRLEKRYRESVEGKLSELNDVTIFFDQLKEAGRGTARPAARGSDASLAVNLQKNNRDLLRLLSLMGPFLSYLSLRILQDVLSITDRRIHQAGQRWQEAVTRTLAVESDSDERRVYDAMIAFFGNGESTLPVRKEGWEWQFVSSLRFLYRALAIAKKQRMNGPQLAVAYHPRSSSSRSFALQARELMRHLHPNVGLMDLAEVGRRNNHDINVALWLSDAMVVHVPRNSQGVDGEELDAATLQGLVVRASVLRRPVHLLVEQGANLGPVIDDSRSQQEAALPPEDGWSMEANRPTRLKLSLQPSAFPVEDPATRAQIAALLREVKLGHLQQRKRQFGYAFDKRVWRAVELLRELAPPSGRTTLTVADIVRAAEADAQLRSGAPINLPEEVRLALSSASALGVGLPDDPKADPNGPIEVVPVVEFMNDTVASNLNRIWQALEERLGAPETEQWLPPVSVTPLASTPSAV